MNCNEYEKASRKRRFDLSRAWTRRSIVWRNQAIALVVSMSNLKAPAGRSAHGRTGCALVFWAPMTALFPLRAWSRWRGRSALHGGGRGTSHEVAASIARERTAIDPLCASGSSAKTAGDLAQCRGQPVDDGDHVSGWTLLWRDHRLSH